MNKTILLIEDNLEYIQMLESILRGHGYQVTKANNGEDGLEIIKENNKSIDIIITDFHMPGINGLELAKEVFAKKMTKAPIIILTTETSVEMRKDGMKAGVHTWIIKPIQKEKFLGTIDLIYERHSQSQ